MYNLILIIHVIICLILIAAILLQSGKGGGLSDLLGGGGTSQTIFGARASTFLTRATTFAASLFLLTCISLTIFSSRSGRSLLDNAELQTEQPAAVATSAENSNQTNEEGTKGSEAQSQAPEELAE